MFQFWFHIKALRSVVPNWWVANQKQTASSFSVLCQKNYFEMYSEFPELWIL